MPTPVFFDTEFSSLTDPHLWSIGLVTLGGAEHYAELDQASEQGEARWAITPWDVREGVGDKFGLIPESLCDSDSALGRRVGEWLLGVASSSPDGRIELLYDYRVDLELLFNALDQDGLLKQVRAAASERLVSAETGAVGPELASEAAYGCLRRRSPPLHRHHALADAVALRAAWRAWHLVHERSPDFASLLSVVGEKQEAWLHGWLAAPAPALGGQVPLDVLDQAGGQQAVVDALHRIEGGCV